MAATPSIPSFPYLRGVLRTTVMQAPASTQINPGDFLYDNGSGVAYPADSFTWTTNLATTQTNFNAVFVGIALDQRLATDPSTGVNILVMTEGDCVFNTAALGGAEDIGTFFGPAQNTGGNYLDNQAVAVVSGKGLAVAKLIEYAPVGATTVTCHMVGTLPVGGVF